MDKLKRLLLGAVAVLSLLTTMEAAGATPIAPAAPENVRVTEGDGVIGVTWAAPASVNPVTHYNVYRGAQPDVLALHATTSGTALTDSVRNGDGYYYAVSAVATAVEGPRSDTVFGRAGRWPDAPSSLTGSLQKRGSSGRNVVRLDWEPPLSDGGSEVLGYRVHDITGAVLATTAPGSTGFEGVVSGDEFAVVAFNRFGASGPAWIRFSGGDGGGGCEWC